MFISPTGNVPNLPPEREEPRENKIISFFKRLIFSEGTEGAVAPLLLEERELENLPSSQHIHPALYALGIQINLEEDEGDFITPYLLERLQGHEEEFADYVIRGDRVLPHSLVPLTFLAGALCQLGYGDRASKRDVHAFIDLLFLDLLEAEKMIKSQLNAQIQQLESYQRVFPELKSKKGESELMRLLEVRERIDGSQITQHVPIDSFQLKGNIYQIIAAGAPAELFLQKIKEDNPSGVDKTYYYSSSDSQAIPVALLHVKEMGENLLNELEIHKGLLENGVPNIPKLITWDDEYIVMENFDTTFYDWLNAQNPDTLPLEEALIQVRSVICDAAEGLLGMHGQNLLHMDMKPENILLNVSDSFVVTKTCIADFGITASPSVAKGILSMAQVQQPNWGPYTLVKRKVPFSFDTFSLGQTLQRAVEKIVFNYADRQSRETFVEKGFPHVSLGEILENSYTEDFGEYFLGGMVPEIVRLENLAQLMMSEIQESRPDLSFVMQQLTES